MVLTKNVKDMNKFEKKDEVRVSIPNWYKYYPKGDDGEILNVDTVWEVIDILKYEEGYRYKIKHSMMIEMFKESELELVRGVKEVFIDKLKSLLREYNARIHAYPQDTKEDNINAVIWLPTESYCDLCPFPIKPSNIE